MESLYKVTFDCNVCGKRCEVRDGRAWWRFSDHSVLTALKRTNEQARERNTDICTEKPAAPAAAWGVE